MNCPQIKRTSSCIQTT